MVSFVNTQETVYYNIEEQAPDVDYILEESAQLLEYTPDIRLAAFYSGFDLQSHFNLYDAFYSRDGASPAILNLISLMDDWTSKSNSETQALIYNSVIFNSQDQLKELINSISSFLVDSYLKTNNIEEPDHFYVTRINNNSILNPTVISNSVSVMPNNISDFFSVDYNVVSDILFNQYQEIPLLEIYEENDIFFPANIATVILQNNRYHHYVLRLKNIIQKALSVNIPLSKTVELYNQYNNSDKLKFEKKSFYLKDKKKYNALVKKEYLAKKALKKGIKKFSNLFGKNKIEHFISGDGFTVEGEKFNWHFKQKSNSSIINLTHSPISHHIPYSLCVLTKDNIVLSDCCVYVVNDTPIIDQLITISLYIQHNEDELLNKTNFFNKRPEFFDNNNLFPESKRIKKNTINIFNEEQAVLNNEFERKRSEYFNHKKKLNDQCLVEVKNVLSSILEIDLELLNFMLLKDSFDLIQKNCNSISDIYQKKHSIFEIENGDSNV